MAATWKSNHKNAIRSRLLIKTAFAELLNEKDMSKITVTDIVERANISRGTFYAHYLDVYDLYAAIQSNMIEAIDDLLERLGTRNVILNPSEAIRRALVFLEKDKAYYRLFATSSNSESLIRRIVGRLEDKFSVEIDAMIPREDLNEVNCYLVFALGGLQYVTLRWIEDRIALSAEQCAEYLFNAYMNTRPAILKKLDEENQKAKDEVSD